MTIWRMYISCWMPMTTNTHSEYVILTAFLLQQCLHECALMFCYTYIACLVICQFCYAQNNYIVVILILRCFSVIMEMVMIYQVWGYLSSEYSNCSFCVTMHRFEGSLLLVSSTQLAAGPSMTVIIYPTTQCHISKDSHFNGNVSELWYIEKVCKYC